MKINKLLSLFLAIILITLSFASCTKIVERDDEENTNMNPQSNKILTYISLRINPEIEMVIDETGKVLSTNAINTDGEVVLSEVNLEDKNVEDAVVDFTEAAVDLGYMDPNAGKDTVYVDVNSENTEVAEKVEKDLSDKIMKFFEKKGIAGKVSKEVLDSYIESAEEWNVSPGHAKIIARVLEANPEITYDELMNLTVKELLELLKKDKHEDKIDAEVKLDYKTELKNLKEEYKELFEIRKEIDDIEDRLEDAFEDDDDDERLSKEEINSLKAELIEKKKQEKILKEEYEKKLNELKEKYKLSSKKVREEHKKEAEKRKCDKKSENDFEDKNNIEKDQNKKIHASHKEKDD